MNHVRVSIKAIIIEDGRLLALRAQDAAGDLYELPGGGQNHGETVPEALSRECLEEIGTVVRIGALRFVRDYVADHHEFAEMEGGVHQVELMFECRLVSRPSMGCAPDRLQTGIEWLELGSLPERRFYPRAVATLLACPPSGAGGPLYLGDVN